MFHLASFSCVAAYFLLPIVAFDRADREPRPKRRRIKALVTASMTAAMLLAVSPTTADQYFFWLPARPVFLAVGLILLLAGNILLVIWAHTGPVGLRPGFEVVRAPPQIWSPKTNSADGPGRIGPI